MGKSTDAILLYGIDFGIDVPWAEEKYNFDWKDWWEEVREREIEVDIVTHCSNEAPAYIISVKGTSRKASRGYPLKITLNDMRYEKFRNHVEPYVHFLIKYFGLNVSKILEQSAWLLCSL